MFFTVGGNLSDGDRHELWRNGVQITIGGISSSTGLRKAGNASVGRPLRPSPLLRRWPSMMPSLSRRTATRCGAMLLGEGLVRRDRQVG